MTGSDWSQTSLELSRFGSAGRLLGLSLICSGDCFRVATRGEILARDLQCGQLSSPPAGRPEKHKGPKNQITKAATSFSGTAHTERTHAVVDVEYEPVRPLFRVVMEDDAPCGLPRLPGIISLSTAPVPSGELQIPLHVHIDNTIIKH